MKGRLKQIHPVLPVRNVSESISYYTDKLGFTLAFKDAVDSPRYAGVKRDAIEIHLQWHDANDWINGMDSCLLRIYAENIDDLFNEYKSNSVFHEQTDLRDTAWGTREFGIYDEDKNGLIFYKDF
ncbi:VOC family protein [Psychroserpens sp.]|uniref:VOC family protein n=1 Tax=Psychroserpens sp. TaxID=2020870 RepID=UPI001B18C47E|nr:VOC family protein [Psychroserpens sp.]MBO6607153.1 glyoxalase/bleomycin resistance/extradiol dioxygenase family protein [Psychroserpens sp.]MBO6631547.1 glyoxalase/bleomycin resistance/extradiol dioxygenase family protein [Psychroserpens sp.]MBO6654299.1 glyoxalase/bleomycin resistance/extradiol dioxygenase family protein [Psychroserpens sp.]MBO6682415.1 glyoxalase/bleomycin resistance/extradiol dioxygenase family protein [Psychroserpens sp.]MBO6750925.1 glyoxalase/bleomycin resistance/ext